MNPIKPRRRRLLRGPQRGKGRCKPCMKIRFPNQDQAYAAALRLSRHVGPIRCYECPHGNGWHLTRRITWADE